jgi:hypothetical protein
VSLSHIQAKILHILTSKFRRLRSLLKNIVLTSKDSKIRDICFVTSKELIWCLLEKLVKIEMVCGMTCHVDHLGLKLIESLVLVKHGFCHLYESCILPFGHPILLRSVGGRKLLLDTFFIKIIFHLSVFELGTNVTSNSLNFSLKFILCSLQEFL